MYPRSFVASDPVRLDEMPIMASVIGILEAPGARHIPAMPLS